MNAVKHLVSKNKRRFKDYGYDLDLSYVTDNIIARERGVNVPQFLG